MSMRGYTQAHILSTCLPVYLSICLSVYLSTYRYICIFVYLPEQAKPLALGLVLLAWAEPIDR